MKYNIWELIGEYLSSHIGVFVKMYTLDNNYIDHEITYEM